MNTAHKALEVIQLAKQYNCHLELAPPDKIKYSSTQQPPEHLLIEIKLNKPVLIEYLKQTKRELSALVKRAYDGYGYCFTQILTQAQRNNVPSCFVRVPTVYWRATVKRVLKINDAELGIIESLLIQSGRLKYMDHTQTLFIIPEQEQQEYLLDDDTGTAFNHWLDMPREFIFC